MVLLYDSPTAILSKRKMNRFIHEFESTSALHLDVQLLSVKYISEYTLHVCFADGIEGNVALDDLVGVGIFDRLKDSSFFSTAYATDHAIAWSDELEIDANKIYLELTGQAHATDQ